MTGPGGGGHVRVLDEILTPAAGPGEPSVVMKARTSGNSRAYQAARDIHITND